MSGGFVWPVCDLGFVDSSFKYHETGPDEFRDRRPGPGGGAPAPRTGPPAACPLRVLRARPRTADPRYHCP